MNSTQQVGIYDRLAKHLDYNEAYNGFTAYCVVIIPKSPRPLNSIYAPSDKGVRRPLRENLRIIDGKSFYEKVTGDPEALEKLYNRIALILGKIKGVNLQPFIKSGTFEEIFARGYTIRP